MATIQTAIQLQDNFTEVFYRVIEAVNLGFVAMEELQQSIGSPVDMTSMEAARDSIHQAAAAVQELNESLQCSSRLNGPNPIVTENRPVRNPPSIPTSPPPTWNSYEGVEVFTNTGAERFQQELASINTMLHQISTQQDQITRRANEMELLSPQASYDLQSVENRVQQLRSQIEQVEANPLTIDTEEINQELERLRLQMNQIGEEQDQLQLAMQGTDISVINQAYLQLSQTLDGVERSVRDRLSKAINSSVTPVEVPLIWRTEELEVFTNTGVERFQQEVQSTNEMLQQLSATQDAIARQAYQMDLLPPEGFQNLNQMAIRMDMIRNRIQQIENNPMNIGTEAVNSELERFRGQLNHAIQEQQNLNHAMQQMDVSAANESYLRLSQIIGSTERYIRDNVDEQGRFNREVEEGTEKSSRLIQTIKGAVAAYATVQTVLKAFNLSDQLTSTTARLNMMNDNLQSTQELQNMIFISAERSRGSYQETADAVSKLGLMAGDAFSSSGEIIAFMEQINKQFRIAGTEASGVDAAMLQLTQAMGSGVLRGEEYNSILEQAPNIIQAIADYMDVSKGKLKDMAAEGQITADIVKAAVFAVADETNAKFESMPKTFEQIWTSFQNHALFAFQPVLQRLNDIANSQTFQAFVNGAIEAMAVLANVLLNIFDLVATIGGFISENWSVISPLIYGVVTALAVYAGYLAIVKTAEFLGVATKIAMCVASYAHAAATKKAASAIAEETARQYGLNTAFLSCPLTWIILLIIALISVIFVVCNAIAKMTGIANSGFSVMTGGINVVIQFFWNLLLTALNIVLGIINAIGALTDNMMIAFSNAICSIQSWFYDLLSTVLTVVGKICEALNRLPFIEFDYSGVTSAAEKYATKAAEVLEKKEEYENVWDAFQKGFHTFDTFQDGWISEAFQKGADWGDDVVEKISGFDLFSTEDLENQDDYTNLLNDTNSLLSGIGDTTKGISDSLDITEEDLKYMRDLAEREIINRVTMTDIKIEMGGVTNHVNSEIDLDGMVNHLVDELGTQLAISAEGIH